MVDLENFRTVKAQVLFVCIFTIGVTNCFTYFKDLFPQMTFTFSVTIQVPEQYERSVQS